jgi:hypothetical protein
MTRIGTHVIEMADVDVVERGDGPCFAPEALGEPLPRDLDGHIPAKARVVRAIDRTHAAGADRRHDPVRVQQRA